MSDQRDVELRTAMWRHRCPDITTAEIVELDPIDRAERDHTEYSGPSLMLAAYRCGYASGYIAAQTDEGIRDARPAQPTDAAAASEDDAPDTHPPQPDDAAPADLGARARTAAVVAALNAPCPDGCKHQIVWHGPGGCMHTTSTVCPCTHTDTTPEGPS